ncbi:protein SFI1 homolog isoform X2 [Sphaeramia orbicularis]|uniref:Sfi1 spindle body domain-containing protein n=1 Tax=Sphaeramia orbicularis TaxID=375764 RepID=A0A672YPU4_9TELE|nr:protein SFI1 homolog isoform X2 [Sphaeramia orbicularis]
MQNNARQSELRPRTSAVRSGSSTKQTRTAQTRKVPYRVGYNWNKGGRLKEIRIRHLARKFLKIWIENTFGRILPHKAKSHYNRATLRRAFEGWRDEWWTSRREWSLTMRAECHHRYYLYHWTFHTWRKFVSLQREKKTKIQTAKSFADRQLMHLVWEKWGFFVDMRKIKRGMVETALQHNRLATLNSAWSLWQIRLQHLQELHTLEDKALKHKALILQHKVWLQWKEKHTAACHHRENESKASLHFIIRLKRKALHHWISYVSYRHNKTKSKAVAQHACCLRLMRMCWSTWNSALHYKWSEEVRLESAGHFAIWSTQRRVLERWRAYVMLCREKAERNQRACEHHKHHLLSVGLRGLSLNANLNKAHRLHNNMALQHCSQTITGKYWRLWQERLEEAEDKNFQHLTERALNLYRTSISNKYFHHWRQKLAELTHMQELEHCADICFAERMLPRCFKSWCEFTLQRRHQKQRKHKADVYNQQRQYTWIFYTWWGQSEKHKEQKLAERMAVLHEERSHMQKAWACWRKRTEQRICEEEKQNASDRLYLHRLLHKTVTQWKDNSTEIRDRRNREILACHQGDLTCMRWALEKWKKFVQKQRVKKSRLQQMQRYHEVKLLKCTFDAWKKHHLQMFHICAQAEELYKQQKKGFQRRVLSVWKENASLQAEFRVMEHQAQDHFQHFLQLKVFVAWREVTSRSMTKRHQQREAVSRLQLSINRVRLLQFFYQWRKQTREVWRERQCMEKAKRHHEAKILSKALTAWNKHHQQWQKYKVMKRQGMLLQRLRVCQTFFDQWKIKLQHRRREVKQTERALWHWSLTLQAKVLFGWRLWVTEQRRKQEEVVRAAQIYRDQLLREGVTSILTYAAHMNSLTTSLTLYSQEQRSRRLQRVVRRCAMRWKQRVLCKPGRKPEVKGQPPKKSVTFCLHETQRDSVTNSEEQEAEGGLFSKIRKPRTPPRHRVELFEFPPTLEPHEGFQKHFSPTSTAAAPKPPDCVTHVSHSEPLMSTVDSPQGTQNQDLLLPPSAFMTTLWTTTCSAPGHPPLVPSCQFVPPFKLHSSHYPDVHLKTFSEISEDATLDVSVTDPASALTNEMLSIQQDMKSYQEDRRQLRAWQKLKDVLQTWLQTSGKDDETEKNTVSQELEELKERIDRLSTELAKQKPVMLLHAQRIEHLQACLHATGVSSLLQAEEMKTNCSVFTT